MNAAAVEAILAAIPDMPLQLGGGIRDMATVDGWLSRGVARVIIGTAAVRDPAFVKAAAKAFPGQVAVGIDARGGKVAVEGGRLWRKPPRSMPPIRQALLEDAGVAALIYTDIAARACCRG